MLSLSIQKIYKAIAASGALRTARRALIRARSLYETMLEQNPDWPELLYELVELLLEAEDHEYIHDPA